MKQRMFISLILLSIISLFLFEACKGPQGDDGITGPQGEKGDPGDYDKQIKLDVGASFGIDVMSDDTLWHTSDTLYHTLLRFNKQNYTKVDSIIFECLAGSFNDVTTCYVRLINLTDNVPINSSTVFAIGPGFNIVSSGNIFNELPDKEITIGIQTKSSISGKEIYSNRFSLYLFRN